MRSCSILALFIAGLCSHLPQAAARFADSVISYHPGTGFATEFGSGLGFTNVSVVLGEPSRITPGAFGGPVDPFNPPFLREQVLSIGAGGSLTVGFSRPILNDPGNPFGLDFLIFGNGGFVITNGNFSGGGITDGTLFGANQGVTRVSVSRDNLNYFVLDPALSPPVDRYFPTDGAGDFSRPVHPSLTGADFSGLALGGIRSLYGGSGGGAGFDLSWARDASGLAAQLESISFIRVDVLEGAAEIDGFAVVPEPGTAAFWCVGLLLLGLRMLRRLS